MKTNTLLLSICTVFLLTQCAGMPSVAGLGAGSDSASINSSRGRADAQMSRAQAEQYSRQRGQVSEEMDLEQKKRHNFYQNAGGAIGLMNGVSNLLR